MGGVARLGLGAKGHLLNQMQGKAKTAHKTAATSSTEPEMCVDGAKRVPCMWRF